MNIYRVILILGFASMTLGFRVLTTKRWRVSESDRTLWVKMCPDMSSKSLPANSIPDGDPLAGLHPTIKQTVQAVLDNYNQIGCSYMRLALYPDDPDNPPAPEPGDSTFTKTASSDRTIDLCFNEDGNPFVGGRTKFEVSGKRIVGCNITMGKDTNGDVLNFTETLTHELGHCIGLDHPMDTVNAIMSYFHSDEDFRLLMDDKMGITHIYPKASCDLKEKNTLGLRCTYR